MSLYVSFMSGLNMTLWHMCCIHSSHIATLASDARRRLCSWATCTRSASTMDDWTVPSGGGEGSNASGFARLFGVSPATLPPETERLPETIGEAGSIEFVDERWLSAGDGGIGFAAGDGGNILVSIVARAPLLRVCSFSSRRQRGFAAEVLNYGVLK